MSDRVWIVERDTITSVRGEPGVCWLTVDDRYTENACLLWTIFEDKALRFADRKSAERMILLTDVLMPSKSKLRAVEVEL